jgi:hypothetical protein
MSGTLDDIQREERIPTRASPRESNDPRQPAALRYRRESSCSTMAVARISVNGVGAAMSDPIISCERGAPWNSSVRPCVASSIPV